MDKRKLINTLFSVGLAVAFYFFFMITKHDMALGKIIPFANDPYDAVGSFAVETTLFLALLSCIRAVRLYREGKQETAQQIFLARTQMGIVLAVLLTLVGDVVAMLRHLPQWTSQPATAELLLMLLGMLVLALVAGALVFLSVRALDQPHPSYLWARGAIALVAMIAILAFYPENLRASIAGELFTVVVGAFLLFVPLWALGDALIPYTLEKQEGKGVFVPGLYQWGVVVLLGICIGLMLVLGESTEGGRGLPSFQFFRHLQIVFVYVGLEVAAIIIGYSFLSKQLGLFRRKA